MRPFTIIALLTTFAVVLATGFASDQRTDAGPPVTKVPTYIASKANWALYLYETNIGSTAPVGVEMAKYTEHDQAKSFHYDKEFVKPVTDLKLDPVWVYVRPSSIYHGHLARLHPGFNKPPSFYRRGIRSSKC